MTRHSQRKTKGISNHSNENIDPSKTKFNIDMTINGKTMEQVAKEKLEKDYKGKRKLRKDQVIGREIITNPTPDHFEGMTMEEKREEMVKFMKDALPWFVEEFGEDNILGGGIHLDEENPHAHFMIMPMTEDGRVSQTEFFKGPKDLARMHKDYRQHMIEKGWDFDLENKYEQIDNVPMKQFKAQAKEIQRRRKEQTDEIRELSQSESIQEQAYLEAYDVVFDVVLKDERERLKKKVENLKKRNRGVLEREKVVSEKEQRLERLEKVMKGSLLEMLDGDESLERQRLAIQKHPLDRFEPEGLRTITSMSILNIREGKTKPKAATYTEIQQNIEEHEDELEL